MGSCEAGVAHLLLVAPRFLPLDHPSGKGRLPTLRVVEAAKLLPGTARWALAAEARKADDENHHDEVRGSTDSDEESPVDRVLRRDRHRWRRGAHGDDGGDNDGVKEDGLR